jgi:2-oxoglutarate ferredoxin oxidoreductase subunit delta
LFYKFILTYIEESERQSIEEMKKGKIRILVDRCKGCTLCVEECPHKEIKMSKKLNNSGYHVPEFLGKGHCTACKLCSIVCPEAAIEVIELVEVEQC